MEKMNITSAHYQKDYEGNNISIGAVINGRQISVPLSQGNRHYAEIMRQVEAGELVIQEADAE